MQQTSSRCGQIQTPLQEMKDKTTTKFAGAFILEMIYTMRQRCCYMYKSWEMGKKVGSDSRQRNWKKK